MKPSVMFLRFTHKWTWSLERAVIIYYALMILGVESIQPSSACTVPFLDPLEDGEKPPFRHLFATSFHLSLSSSGF